MEGIALKYHVSCPWCGKGRSYLSEDGTGCVSAQCAKCGHYYLLNLKTRQTLKMMKLAGTIRPAKR